jgi:small subunit ribosomal protein S4e
MAKKGERKGQKRLSAGKTVKLGRKELTWLLKSKPGQHKRAESIPLGFAVRDLMGLTENMRETKIVLSGGAILVNGIVRRSPRFPVGLFDVIAVPEQKKQFRLLFDRKGRFELQEVSAKEKGLKLSRVAGKRAVKKGLIQLETSDGRTITEKKSSLKPGDSMLIALPGQKIMKEIKMGKGSVVYIVGGEHAGETAKVKEVIAGTMKRPRLVLLEEKDSQFLTVAENVFVVGEKKPEISLKV